MKKKNETKYAQNISVIKTIHNEIEADHNWVEIDAMISFKSVSKSRLIFEKLIALSVNSHHRIM